MSNKLLLLLILGVVFFSACSDDDKDPNYDGTYKDSGLELSRDGMVLSGKSVALSGNTLTLGNVIPRQEYAKNYSRICVSVPHDKLVKYFETI